jgi:hypothetical protein
MTTNPRNTVLMLILCSACSGSVTQRVGSQYVKTGTFGPSGGTLTVAASDDPTLQGTQIVIPPGALSLQTLIQIGVSNQPVVSSGALGPIIDFEPSPTTFAKPVTVTIPVTLAGTSPSHVGVMAVETDGTSHDITAVTVASGGVSSLATFQVSGFTHYGAHFESGDDDSDGGCTPSCDTSAACGSSDGCGGTCNGNCDAGTCTPQCASDAGCGSSDGCGGTCDDNCDGGTCVPQCIEGTCGTSDGCGGTCDQNCDDAGSCVPQCGSDAGCGSDDGCGSTCNDNCPGGGPCLIVNPTSLDFGEVGVNDAGVFLTGNAMSFQVTTQCANSVIQWMTVQNGSWDIVPQFSVPAGPPLPASLPLGTALDFDEFCEPTSEGAHTARLLISDGTLITPLSLTCEAP